MKFNTKSEMLNKYLKYIILIILIACFMTISDFITAKTPVKELDRPSTKDDYLEENLTYKADGRKGEVTAEVNAKVLSSKEEAKYIKRAKKEIDESFLGENSDKEHINKNLNLESTYADAFVDCYYDFSPDDFIDLDGTVHFEDIKEDTLITVFCTLDCGDTSEVYSFPIKILKPEIDDAEGFSYFLKGAMSDADEAKSEKYVLPEKIANKKISFYRSFDKRGPILLILGILMIPVIIFGEKEKDKKDKKEYQKMLSANYAVIVEKLALFVNAGIRPKEAFRRILDGRKKLKKKGKMENAGYREIEEMLRSMENGTSEAGAYINLGERTDNKDYRRLSLLLSENLSKGDRFLADELMNEERDAFQKRKHRALALGEEASTKMVFPMVLLLISVMIVLIVPAWMSMDI